MNCNCCGIEIDRVLVNVFLPDGSDKEALIQFSDNGEETYCLETDQSWTGYELCEEEQIETIKCPKCRKFPFKTRTLDVSEPVYLIFW